MSLLTKDAGASINKYLLTIFTIIFSEFLIMGISLGILPGFVHDVLHFNNFIVGVVIGLQYIATLLTRHLAGQTADQHGGKRAARIGLFLSALSGIFTIFSSLTVQSPLLSLMLICTGRVLLGIGESYLIIGLFAWGFTLVGPKNTGKVMVWNGLGMYGGISCGAPLAVYLQGKEGLLITFSVIVILPVIGYGMALLLPKVAVPKLEKRLPFYRAVKLVWRSGTGLAMASIGLSGIASFITLYFKQQGWAHTSIALTSFGAGYLTLRLFLAHLPDKFGGAKVAVCCLLVEIVGQLLLWQATNESMAILGSVLTGCGMSLVFPSFGQLAIRHVPIPNRGMAMAAYNAFFDLGMSLTAPVAGLIAGRTHYEYIYLFGGLAAVIGLLLALREFFDKSSLQT